MKSGVIEFVVFVINVSEVEQVQFVTSIVSKLSSSVERDAMSLLLSGAFIPPSYYLAVYMSCRACK